MKAAISSFNATACRSCLLSSILLLAGPAQAQTTIALNNSGQQNFAVDAARHFLYVAEAAGTGTKHLNVINTLTNTVVGTYDYTASGYSAQVSASGTNVFWADQGGNVLRVIAVDGSGTPSLTRSDTTSLATGVAALATTYAVSSQASSALDIRQISDGSAAFTGIALGGVAGNVYADANTGYYYARSTNNYKVINSATGSVVNTLTGLVAAIDSAPAHNFVYLGLTANVLTQLNASTHVANPTTYDFGASITDVAINSLNGDIFVALESLDKVVQLNASMTFLQEYAVTDAQSLAFVDGQLYVHPSAAGNLQVIAVPEPATWSVLLGSLGLLLAVLRRRTA